MRTATRAGALLTVAALILAGCGSDDPADVLQSAFERTVDGSFAYEFGIQADRDALATLGEGAAQAAAFLSGFGIAGRVDGDRSVVRVRALGMDALEVRVLSPQEIYARLGLGELAAVAGVPLGRDQVVRALEGLDLPATIVEAGVALSEDRWVGVEGEFPTERIRELVAPGQQPDEEALEQQVDEAFGADIGGFLERFVVVNASGEEDGLRTFTVALRLRDLLRAAARLNQQVTPGAEGSLEDLEADLGELPEEVPGTVEVRDGVVTRVGFDVAGDDAAGAVELDLRFTQHEDVEAVTAPGDVTVVPADDLATALERLLAFTGGLTPPN